MSAFPWSHLRPVTGEKVTDLVDEYLLNKIIDALDVMNMVSKANFIYSYCVLTGPIEAADSKLNAFIPKRADEDWSKPTTMDVD